MQNNPIGTDLCAGCDHRDLCDPDSGCAEWRRRFIEWWDTNIHRDLTEPKPTKQYFTYAHPDEKEE